jgi:hypothetical protein
MGNGEMNQTTLGNGRINLTKRECYIILVLSFSTKEKCYDTRPKIPVGCPPRAVEEGPGVSLTSKRNKLASTNFKPFNPRLDFGTL